MQDWPRLTDMSFGFLIEMMRCCLNCFGVETMKPNSDLFWIRDNRQVVFAYDPDYDGRSRLRVNSEMEFSDEDYEKKLYELCDQYEEQIKIDLPHSIEIIRDPRSDIIYSSAIKWIEENTAGYWSTMVSRVYYERNDNTGNPMGKIKITFSFSAASDAVLFKLSWYDTI